MNECARKNAGEEPYHHGQISMANGSKDYGVEPRLDMLNDCDAVLFGHLENRYVCSRDGYPRLGRLHHLTLLLRHHLTPLLHRHRLKGHRGHRHMHLTSARRRIHRELLSSHLGHWSN